MFFLRYVLFLLRRVIVSVIFGGAGTAAPVVGGKVTVMEGEITVSTVDNPIERLIEASDIMTVPGYGMAVALSQLSVADIVKKLQVDG